MKDSINYANIILMHTFSLISGLLSKKATKIPTSPYRVILQVNDTSLLEGYGSGVVRSTYKNSVILDIQIIM